MRLLLSTFGPGDAERILNAMRLLPYDKLVLVGEEGAQESPDFSRLERLENMSNKKIEFQPIFDSGFLGMVDSVSDMLAGYTANRQDTVYVNISGGAKLLGDAALLAAFRLGVETYHCDGRLTRLPVIKGATARDRFTAAQARLIEAIGETGIPYSGLIGAMDGMSKSSLDRVIREVKKAGLMTSHTTEGVLRITLTPAGVEVLHALKLTRRV
ncbi:MAG: MarR family winged helix-turn-helix transcriptional regulator [Thermoplasmata archaeon]|nr:MarR family winged helix-turn-helix transcriptional regulator [Thermoplasmata archaeon]